MTEALVERFEADRAHLRSVAQRILGSPDEAEDAVQETWVRLSRSDTSEVTNLTGWLTTVVSRVCLDMLRARGTRREDPAELPETAAGEDADPEQEVVLADSIGPALLLVLDTLGPGERLAFVLHDMFAVPFPEIAGIIGCSPAAARQLASRARRRVQGVGPGAGQPLASDGSAAHDGDRASSAGSTGSPSAASSPRSASSPVSASEAGGRQALRGLPGADGLRAENVARSRTVVDAFLAASRGGDFSALLALLDPQVVLRADA